MEKICPEICSEIAKNEQNALLLGLRVYNFFDYQLFSSSLFLI